MSSIVLNDNRWKVETGGLWRVLWSMIIRDIEYSNWLVTNKKTGEKWRLTDQEETFLHDFAERVNAVQFAPEFQNQSKTERKRMSQLALADCLDAIAMSRQGEISRMEDLAGLNQPELTTHLYTLWGL
jgi:hypothetical protein